MRLVREVPLRDRHTSTRRVLLGLGAGAFVLGFLCGPEILRGAGDSKAQIARNNVRTYATDAYARWRLLNPSRACPPDVMTLANLVGHQGDRDPYGEAYQLHCNERGLYIQSFGEDATSGTADDLWSHSSTNLWSHR